MSDKIKLYVSNTVTYISGRLPSAVYQGLRKLLGYRPETAFFKIQKTNKHWDGIESTLHFNEKSCKCSIKKKGTHFPTGLFNKARDFLVSENIGFEVYDTREAVEKNIELEMSDNFELRDYQRKVIEDAANRQRGIVKSSTGSGKTAIAAGIIQKVGVSPFVFYVPSIDLLQQTQQEFSKFLKHKGSPLEVGSIGNGKVDIKDINIMTIQTAVRSLGGKYIKFDDEDKNKLSKEDEKMIKQKKDDILSLIQSAKGFMGDEVQHWASETAQIIADNSFNARYRWGLSATPWRDKGDDILIDACFGREICNITASFLIDHPNKYLVRPDIYLLPFDLGMPKDDLFSYHEYYKIGIVENIQRNNYIAKIAKNFEEQGRTVLILCQQVTHGKMLEQLIDGCVFLHGEHSAKVRKAHLQKMREGKAGVTIATSIFDEGIDCRPLDTLILAGGGKSQTRALQRVGRVLRPYTSPEGKKKEGAIVIDIQDHCKYLSAHAKKRKKIYETEPSFNIKKIKA